MSRPTFRVVACAGLLTLAGCGHPATRSECEEIMTHTAEIELRGQNVTDPKQIAQRMSDPGSMQKMKDGVEKCIGKRVTNSAMECVRKSNVAKEMDACFQ